MTPARQNSNRAVVFPTIPFLTFGLLAILRPGASMADAQPSAKDPRVETTAGGQEVEEKKKAHPGKVEPAPQTGSGKKKQKAKGEKRGEIVVAPIPISSPAI